MQNSQSTKLINYLGRTDVTPKYKASLLEQKRLGNNQLVNLILDLGLNKYNGEKFIGFVGEISKREEITPNQVIDKARHIIENENIKRPHKIDLLCRFFYEMRNPNITSGRMDVKNIGYKMDDNFISKRLSFVPSQIYINKDCVNYSITRRIIDHYKNTEKKEIDSIRDVDFFKSFKNKSVLYLTKNRGEFVKKCPGTKGVVCCNYHTINLVTGCTIDCSYCILQAYLNNNSIRINVNLEDLWAELTLFIKKFKGKYLRIGTGELADSLILDDVTNISTEILNFFSKYPEVIFEFKTKSKNIENLLNWSGDKKNIVVGFSMNPKKIINSDEKHAASLDERITAIDRVLNASYKTSIHFDPIVLYEDWEQDYKDVVDKIFSKINNRYDQVAWVSMGLLRYMPKLKRIAKERFPNSKIFLGEFIKDDYNKMRYFEPIRIEAYKKILSYFNKHKKDLPIYLCMETKEVWESVFGEMPSKQTLLKSIF